MPHDTDGVEPSSFRDPSGSIYHSKGRILRGLDVRGAADWKALKDTRFFNEMMADGRIVATSEASLNELPELARHSAAALEHERIPFISYPYEWTFRMLREAAILHLEILLAALDEGFTTKDGYSFNVQFRGGSPVFIDVGSFEPVGDGGPWVGYRQFTQTFLFPLMIEAYLGIPFQQILRGHLEGIDTNEMRRLLGVRGSIRKGVLKHVVIHDILTNRVQTASQETRTSLTQAGAGTDLAKASVTKLLKLVETLASPRAESVWADYRTTCSYSDADTAAKTRFIEGVLGELTPRLVFDLGCNDGRFSKQASPHAEHVIAVDFDPLVVDNFYRDMRDVGSPTNVLPLVQDLTDPSPARGWRGLERKAFFDRERPDLVMALALIHHLSIGANVPLAQVIDFLASLTNELIVEFVEPHDPMAKRLLSNKPAGTHDDYRTEVFEELLGKRCEIVTSERLPGGSRRLYHARPR